MPMAKIEKSVRIGDRVTHQNKLGTVLDRMGDVVYVVFDDGEKAFLETTLLDSYMQDTRLKDSICPFCKGYGVLVSQEKSYGGAEVFQCTKCSQKYSLE